MHPAIHAVVAYVPANVRYPLVVPEASPPHGPWKGIPLAYAHPTSNESAPVDMDAKIAVEQTHGPVLMIAGEEDGVWPSSIMTNAAMNRLQVAHFRYNSASRLSATPDTAPEIRLFVVPTWSERR